MKKTTTLIGLMSVLSYGTSYGQIKADGVSGGTITGSLLTTTNMIFGDGTNGGSDNTFVGGGVAKHPTITGSRNSFLGRFTGNQNTGSYNTFMGHYTGANNTGSYNTFLGENTGADNQGNQNTFIGQWVGGKNLGTANTFVGAWTGNENTTGTANTFVGMFCGVENISGSHNVFLGQHCAPVSTNGWSNVFLGHYAAPNNTLGNNNVFMGRESGIGNTTGNNNVSIGYLSGFNSGAYTNAISIGYNARVAANNSMSLGGLGNTANAIKVGIGTASPATDLHIEKSYDANAGVAILGHSKRDDQFSRLNLRAGNDPVNDLILNMYSATIGSKTGGLGNILAPLVGVGSAPGVSYDNLAFMESKRSPLMIGMSPAPLQGAGNTQNIYFVNNVQRNSGSSTLTLWECMRINQNNGFVGIHTRSATTGAGTGAPQALFHVNLTNPGVQSLNTATNGIRFEGLPQLDHPDVIVIDANGNLARRTYNGGGSGDDWHLAGNTTGGTEFIGTLTDDDFRIRTNNTQRGRFTADGTTGTLGNFEFGAGSSFSGVTDKSVAFGQGHSITNSLNAFATGGGNIISNTSHYSMISGISNTIDESEAAFSSGNTNNIDRADNSITVGNNNTITNSVNAVAMGEENTIQNSTALVSSDQSVAFGTLNTITGSRSAFAAGHSNEIIHSNGVGCATIGVGNRISNSNESVAAGEKNEITNAHGTFVAGGHNYSDGKYNILLGQKLNASSLTPPPIDIPVGNNIIIIGEQLSSNVDNSLTMGFEGNRTMVITKRGVNIQNNPTGTTTFTPNYNLEVDAMPDASTPFVSNIAFHNLPSKSGLPVVLIDPGTGELYKSNHLMGMEIDSPSYLFTPVLSDAKTSSNMGQINNAMELISKMEPKQYTLDNTQYPGLKLPENKTVFGLIAQDLEKVLPGLVEEVKVPAEGDTEPLKGVKYEELVPVLIQAVKDQQNQIDQQQAQIDQLMAALKEIRADKANEKEVYGRIDIELSDKDVVVLNQNIPNPCDQYTSIGFNIPASAQQVSINFLSVDGKLLKSIPVQQRGKGAVNVYTSEMTPGTYVYTLIVDGQIAVSKKMEINR